QSRGVRTPWASACPLCRPVSIGPQGAGTAARCSMEGLKSMRWLRLSYVVPRIAVLVVLYLLAEFGSGYAVRWGLTSGVSALVGAKVEIDHAKASLLETQLLLTDLQIANPKSPMKNLLEAERIELDFSTTQLLRKKLVAEYGIVS